MTDLATVRKLTEEQDAAQRQAAQIARPAHQKAMKAARECREALAATISNNGRRDRMAALIEASVDERALPLDTAATVLAQYPETVFSSHEPARLRRSGAAMLEGFALRTHQQGFSREFRLKALDAFVLAARGKVETGLIEMPESWSIHVTADDMEQLAKMADPDGFAEYHAEQEKLAAEYRDACRYCQALEQCSPQLFVTSVGEEAVVYLKHNGGGLGAAGINIAGDGEITELDLEDFVRFRNDPLAQAHLASGQLEVVSSDELVEPA